MAVSVDEARALVAEWTTNPSLFQHARAVELAMRAAALRHGGDVERWGMTGLVHDADYDRWPEEHPKRVIAWLEEHGEPEVAHAVLCHYDLEEEPRELMDRAIVACDELAGFVVACSLVRPEGIGTLGVSSVKKKLKDKAFAAKVDREVIRRGVERLGVTLEEQIELVIEALKPHAEELGIGGRGRRVERGRLLFGRNGALGCRDGVGTARDVAGRSCWGG